jgi:hypothetical protein
MPNYFENAEAYVCTPSSLLASNPCLDCYGEVELLAALVGVLAMNAGTSIPQLAEDASCFKCMSKKQFLQAFVTIVGNQVLGERYSAQDVIDQYHCLTCYSELELKAMLLSLICALTVTVEQPQ